MKTIKIEMLEFHNKAKRKMRDIAILLLLRRMLSDAVTFCAYEKIREPTIAEKRHR
jgi:hypothetical protein